MDRLGLSALDWWREAGVDVLVEDAPSDWLATPGTVADVPSPTRVPDPAPAAALPTDLPGFRAWLRTDAGVPGPAAARLDAEGDPGSGAMVVVDVPEAGDRAAGRLVSGEVGELLDRMLVPMGLSRDRIYLAPLSPARPATGRLDTARIAALAPLMRHHVALIAPKRLLLFGDAAIRALLDINCADARGRVHALALPGLTVPTVATFHPRVLARTPARKAAAWADLKLYMAL